MKRSGKWLALCSAVVIGAAGVCGYRDYKEKLRAEQERHEEAMRLLDEELAGNRKVIDRASEKYAAAQTEIWENENDPAFREEAVQPAALHADFIGDSVMLGAAQNLKNAFPEAYVDAEVNRSYYPMYNIISSRASKGILGDPVVIGIGTNGPLSDSVCRSTLDLCKDRQVFWLTTNNNQQFFNTDTILAFGEDYDNVTIIDWDTFSDGHSEYFYKDGIHLNPTGREAYVSLIKDSITARCWDLMPHEHNRTLLAGDACLETCPALLGRISDEYDILCEEELSADMVIKRLAQLEEKHILPENLLVCARDAELIGQIRDAVHAAYDSVHTETILVLTEEEEEKPDPETLLPLYETCGTVFAEDQIHLSEEASALLAKEILAKISE